MNEDKGTVVVFGATGTLGTYLIDELADRGYGVFACAWRDYRRRALPGEGRPLRIGGHRHQVRLWRLAPDGGSRRGAYRGGDALAHVGIQAANLYRCQHHRHVERAGILPLGGRGSICLHAVPFRRGGVLEYAAADAADSPRRLNLKGDHAVYIVTKNAAVDLVEHYHQEYNLRTAVLRLPTIYCYTPINEMYVNGEKKPIAYLYMIERARRGESLEIWGDPNIAKDMVYVKDYTQIVLGAVESDKGQGLYNVGTGIGTTLEQQIRGIIEIFSPAGKPSAVIYRPESGPSQSGFIYDISKTRAELGYQPRFSYLEMLRDMKTGMEHPRFAEMKTADLEI